MKRLLVLVFFVLFVVSPNPSMSEDITLSSAPRGGDVDSCGDDNGGGGGGGGVSLSPLTISGNEPVSVGSQYTAGGGVKPYNWSISCGAIDSSGTVTSLAGCCDAGSVTVKDYLGAEASIPIMFSSPVTLAGSETPVVSTQYLATSGVAPYTWDISCGEIDSTGKVTSVAGCCGSGTVAVTDSCGQSASMSVRFALGQWVWVSSIANDNTFSCFSYGTYPCSNYPSCISPSNPTFGVVWEPTPVGDTWYAYYGLCWGAGQHGDYHPCYPPVPDASCGVGSRVYWQATRVHKWQCQ